MSLDADDEESGSVMQRKKAQKKEKKGLSKGSRLSFGNVEPEAGDGTPFKPKKSLLSQSIKLPSTPSATANDSPSSSIYSSEYLSQLKANTPSRGPKVDDEEDEDEGEESGGLSRAAREKFASTLREDTTAGIPDEAAIAAARMKRQAAVNTAKRGVESEDYISLGGGQIAVWDGEKGPHPESRLMREEDEGEEGDEGGSRAGWKRC
jgi:GC-rich sequence DNA-binding factor